MEDARRAYVQGLDIISRIAPGAVQEAVKSLPEAVRNTVESDNASLAKRGNSAQVSQSDPGRRYGQMPRELGHGGMKMDNRIVIPDSSESDDDD